MNEACMLIWSSNQQIFMEILPFQIWDIVVREKTRRTNLLQHFSQQETRGLSKQCERGKCNEKIIYKDMSRF